jgi:uncharacterized protein with HEPN domain
MQPDDDDALIVDMWLYATKARRLVGVSDYNDFLDDELLQLALVKLIENIGEAARRVSIGLQSSVPGVPWQNITGMRHRLVHDYRNVDLQVVWDTVEHDLAVLIEHLQPLLPPDDSGERS